MDYAEWTKAEIAHKREQAKLLQAQADGMEEALRHWQDSQRGAAPGAPATGANGHAPQKRWIGPSKSGTAFVMAKIAEGSGVSNDELFNGLASAGYGMKRTSLRSILWHAKEAKDIENRDGKWYPGEKGPNA